VYRCDPHILPVPPEVPEVAGLVGSGAEGAGIGGPYVCSVLGGGACPFLGCVAAGPRGVPVFEVVPEVIPLRYPR